LSDLEAWVSFKRYKSCMDACMHHSASVLILAPPAVQSFSLLGSTGSIGTQTLEIIAEHPDKFRLTAMAAGSNVDLLAKQVRCTLRCMLLLL